VVHFASSEPSGNAIAITVVLVLAGGTAGNSDQPVP
jgi:hypothetical protein